MSPPNPLDQQQKLLFKLGKRSRELLEADVVETPLEQQIRITKMLAEFWVRKSAENEHVHMTRKENNNTMNEYLSDVIKKSE